jgi:hypothetical protein
VSFVVDASMAAAWILPDERGAATGAIMDRLDYKLIVESRKGAVA